MSEEIQGVRFCTVKPKPFEVKLEVVTEDGKKEEAVFEVQRLTSSYQDELLLQCLTGRTGAQAIDEKMRVFAFAAVVGWKGVLGEDGVELEFEREKSWKKVWEYLPDLVIERLYRAATRELTGEIREESVKNSKATSDSD